jgi:hypothetical protein
LLERITPPPLPGFRGVVAGNMVIHILYVYNIWRPFFEKHIIYGAKALDFKDFCTGIEVLILKIKVI